MRQRHGLPASGELALEQPAWLPRAHPAFLNHEHGHVVGDDALVRIVARLQEIAGDRAVRTSGGDCVVAA